MLRVIRNHRRAAYGHTRRLREARRSHRCRSTTRAARTSASLTPPRRAWDRAIELGQDARLPQCAVDRHCADRHHRSRHGLRHDRHRAGLRAREVQEAGRRRLLQDHQPRRSRSAAYARLSRERDRRDRRPMPWVTARCKQAPAINVSTLKARGFTDEALAKIEAGLWTPRSTSSSCSTGGRSARSS